MQQYQTQQRQVVLLPGQQAAFPCSHIAVRRSGEQLISLFALDGQGGFLGVDVVNTLSSCRGILAMAERLREAEVTRLAFDKAKVPPRWRPAGDTAIQMVMMPVAAVVHSATHLLESDVIQLLFGYPSPGLAAMPSENIWMLPATIEVSIPSSLFLRWVADLGEELEEKAE